MTIPRTLRWRALLAIGLLFLITAPLRAEESPTPVGGDAPYYFYHGRDYGSESLIHPLRLVINGGYGIMQIANRDNRPFDIDYAQGWRNV